MKRFWLGILVLAVLLGGCCLIRTALEKIHQPIAADLEQAAAAALTQDWATALDKAEHAFVRWEKFHHFTAAFTDHTPMEELDGLFQELKIYAWEQENPHFSATCARISLLAASFAESHRLSWWNLL